MWHANNKDSSGGGCYLNKGVLAIHSLANGQSFGYTLSGGHDGALGQTLLQLF